MNVFKVLNDSNNIRLLGVIEEEKNTLENLTFNCVSRAGNWQVLDVYIMNPNVPAKNFYALPSGVLVFDEIALACCRTIFEMAGEILTLKAESGENLYLLNVLNCVNGLNNQTSVRATYKDGSKGRILKYTFHQNRITTESTIFKIPETSKSEIFTYSGLKDLEDEFVGIYKTNNLSGLVFEPVWSSGNLP